MIEKLKRLGKEKKGRFIHLRNEIINAVEAVEIDGTVEEKIEHMLFCHRKSKKLCCICTFADYSPLKYPCSDCNEETKEKFIKKGGVVN